MQPLFSTFQFISTVLFVVTLLCNKILYFLDDVSSLTGQSFQYVEHTWPNFKTSVQEAGWKLTPVQLCADEWRAEWDLQGLDSKKVLSHESLGVKIF